MFSAVMCSRAFHLTGHKIYTDHLLAPGVEAINEDSGEVLVLVLG